VGGVGWERPADPTEDQGDVGDCQEVDRSVWRRLYNPEGVAKEGARPQSTANWYAPSATAKQKLPAGKAFFEEIMQIPIEE
jgi:hypothetical protein